MNRRQFLAAAAALAAQTAKRPNILFAIADDQSWLHTSFAGDPVVKTPNFDRIARAGVYCNNAFSTCPGCAPSRASVLTGRSIWQLEEAGTHASFFPKKFTVFPDLLRAAGYFTGLTGKGAGPANFKGAGWAHNPAGPSFDEHKVDKTTPRTSTISSANGRKSSRSSSGSGATNHTAATRPAPARPRARTHRRCPYRHSCRTRRKCARTCWITTRRSSISTGN
jgi:arylsulfatase A-like enzyme